MCWYLAKCVTGGSVLLVEFKEKGEFDKIYTTFQPTQVEKWVDLSAVAVASLMDSPPDMLWFSQTPTKFCFGYLQPYNQAPVVDKLIELLNAKLVCIEERDKTGKLEQAKFEKSNSTTNVIKLKEVTLEHLSKVFRNGQDVAPGEFVKFVSLLERL